LQHYIDNHRLEPRRFNLANVRKGAPYLILRIFRNFLVFMQWLLFPTLKKSIPDIFIQVNQLAIRYEQDFGNNRV
jgi:hypothetical protein